MSSVIAVDVALLLPTGLCESLVELNATTLAPPDGFRFDATHLPHLTLAQQFVADGQLDPLTNDLGAVIGDLPPLELVTTTMSRDGMSSTLGVETTPALDTLHRGLMDLLARYPALEGRDDAFLTDGDPPRAADIEWVRCFRARSAYERFRPHVTVGVGQVNGSLSSTSFLPPRAALCQLGRFCTCRRVLAEWTLTASER